MEKENEKMDGRVVNFNAARGFGFISPDGVDPEADRENNYFLHVTELAEESVVPQIGGRVLFVGAENAKGKYASEVSIVGRGDGPCQPG